MLDLGEGGKAVRVEEYASGILQRSEQFQGFIEVIPHRLRQFPSG